MKKVLLSLILSVSLFAITYAGDVSDYSILGFSEDSRYVAFEFSGVADGSGFPYIQIFVYDCQEHKLAEEPFFNIIQILDDEEFKKGVALAWDNSTEELEKTLQKYSISPVDKGLPAIKRMDYAPQLLSAGFDFNGKHVVIELEVIEGTETIYDMYTPSGIRVTSEVNGKETVLLSKEPNRDMGKLRFDYSIEEIVICRNTFAAIISYHAPGFEGYNTRQMIVGDIIE